MRTLEIFAFRARHPEQYARDDVVDTRRRRKKKNVFFSNFAQSGLFILCAAGGRGERIPSARDKKKTLPFARAGLDHRVCSIFSFGKQ